MMLAMVWPALTDTPAAPWSSAQNPFPETEKSTRQVEVSGVESTDARDQIVAKAEEALALLYDSETYRFSVSPRWIPGSLQRVPAEAIGEVRPDGSVERYTNFEVNYTENGRAQTASVQLLVDTERKLPVAAERIMSGTVLQPQDLDIRWVAVPNDRSQLVEQAGEVEGKTLRRTLAGGQPIRYADITSEYLVEAGDMVTLVYEQNGLRIELEGEARQSGAQDEEITLYNKETRKRYSGKISSPGVVLWTKTH